jgi:hypothetical protein
MEWVILIIVAFAFWGAYRLYKRAAETNAHPNNSGSPRPDVGQDGDGRLSSAPEPAVSRDIDPSQIADLRDLPSIRTRVKGSAFVVSDANRERFGGTEYELRREPTNPHDSHAVAVYGQGRKVGYISAAKAASVAPLLDALPEVAFVVGGAGVESNSIRLWVDVPSIPALRQYVKGRSHNIQR